MLRLFFSHCTMPDASVGAGIFAWGGLGSVLPWRGERCRIGRIIPKLTLVQFGEFVFLITFFRYMVFKIINVFFKEWFNRLFSPPTRWGSLDFNEGATPPPSSPPPSSSPLPLAPTPAPSCPHLRLLSALSCCQLVVTAGCASEQWRAPGPEPMPERRPDRMPERMSGCQIECQKECENTCQIEC